MFYLDPKSDIIFKKLFGSSAHKTILISFLNAVLAKTQVKPIVDVVITDPTNFPERKASKKTIVDVRCTDELNNQYIVEMQVVTQRDFTQRAEYYTACGITSQLSSQEKYYKLLPVIFIGVLDFSLLKTDKYISHHRTLDIENNNWEFQLTEYHIIELPKFSKEVTEESDFLDKWIYFLKYATTLEEVPQNLDNPILNEAFEVLATTNLSKEEFIIYNEYLDDIRCAESQLETAEEIGEAKGIAKGKLEEKKAIALNLLAFHDSKTIAQITGLRVEEVEELKKIKNKKI